MQWPNGGAGGEHDHADIAVGNLHIDLVGGSIHDLVEATNLDILEARQIVGVVDIARHIDRSHVGNRILDLGQPGQVFRLENADARLGVGQHMGQEGALEGGVDPHQNPADAAEPEPGPEVFEAVVQHHRHIVAEADTNGGIAIAGPVGQGVRFAIGVHMPGLELDQRCVGPHPGLLRQDLTHNPTRFIRRHAVPLPEERVPLF